MAVVLVLGVSWVAFATTSIKNQFNNPSIYGTAGTVLDQNVNFCLLCHTANPGTGGNLDPYGLALQNSGINFAAVELLDSDGDGFNNIAEIRRRTFPGNPASYPVAHKIDFVGDGLSDLAGITLAGSIFYTTNLQTWVNIPGGLTQVVAGDFDHDGRSELARLDSTGNIVYTTDLLTWVNIPGGFSQLVVEDFDGDGLSELAGLTSGGNTFYTTNLSIWTQIPGVLLELAKQEVCGSPFIERVIRYLSMQGLTEFCISIGYKADVIE